MNLKHNSPATKVTDTTNIFWVAAALCWQSAGCNYIGPTQTRPAFYWLQLHWGKYDILTEFRVCCSSVRMKQLQFLLSNNRGPEVFARKKTPTINCHQNDNYHDHHWDETLRTVPVASESIRFYISTYSARFTLTIQSLLFRISTSYLPRQTRALLRMGRSVILYSDILLRTMRTIDDKNMFVVVSNNEWLWSSQVIVHLNRVVGLDANESVGRNTLDDDRIS